MRVKITYLLFVFALCSISCYAQNDLDSFLQKENKTYHANQLDSLQEEIKKTTEDDATDDVTAAEEVSTYNEDEESDSTELLEFDNEEWQKIKNDKSFVYKHNIKRKEKVKQTKEYKDPTWLKALFSFFSSLFFRVTIIGLVVAFLLYILYNLFKDTNFSFGKKKKKQEILTNDVAEIDIIETDLKSILQEAIQNGEYRQATRLLYLQTLKELNERNIILYAHEKTNWEYVRNLQNTTYGTDFRNLTTYYEYIWYGNFEITKETFETLYNSFKTFNDNL